MTYLAFGVVAVASFLVGMFCGSVWAAFVIARWILARIPATTEPAEEADEDVREGTVTEHSWDTSGWGRTH